MKQISPIGIFYNGQTVQANYLQLYCANDNLVDSAIFNYILIYLDSTNTKTAVAQGQLIMEGADYINGWNTNQEAYNWAGVKMNITFI